MNLLHFLRVPRPQNRLRLLALPAAIFSIFVSNIYATVLGFDDFSQDTNLTNTGYANLSWESGNAGVGGANGYWAVRTAGTHFPYSGINNLSNAGGSTLVGISLPALADLAGAYIAGQGEQPNWATGLRAHGFSGGQEISVTAWFTTIDATPRWFDMSGLSHIDRVVFESSPSIVDQNTGYFGMDDLTFTAIPEPAALALLAFSPLLLSRRRGLAKVGRA